ncbi:MAG: hypothetical protein R3F38_15875 [Gammaproteobacteria bacterium]
MQRVSHDDNNNRAPQAAVPALARHPTALALIEALFPAGRILPGLDSQALAASVAQYADRIPGLGAGLNAALLALEARFSCSTGVPSARHR